MDSRYMRGLAEQIGKKTGVSHRYIKKIINAIFCESRNVLVDEKKLFIPQLGTFTLEDKKLTFYPSMPFKRKIAEVNRQPDNPFPNSNINDNKSE